MAYSTGFHTSIHFLEKMHLSNIGLNPANRCGIVAHPHPRRRSFSRLTNRRDLVNFTYGMSKVQSAEWRSSLFLLEVPVYDRASLPLLRVTI